MNNIPRDNNATPKYGYDSQEEVFRVASMVWNPVTLEWEKMTQPIIDATNSNLYLSIDEVEDLLSDIKANTTVFEPTSISITTSGTIKTITETDGDRTRITTIDYTDPDDKQINTVWS